MLTLVIPGSPWAPSEFTWLESKGGKHWVYQMAWNQIQGQVPLSEPRVSVLTAPCPSSVSAQLLVLQVCGSSSGLSPAQLLLPYSAPVTATVMGVSTEGGGLHADPTDKSS